MIKLTNILEDLVLELKSFKGHYANVDNAIQIKDIVDWKNVDVKKFKQFLDGSEIKYTKQSTDPLKIYLSIESGAPEAYYWLWKHRPGKELKALITKDSYTLYTYNAYSSDGIVNHVLIDDANGQVLGLIRATRQDDPSYEEWFGVAPWAVSLSEMVPSVRGSGEGKIMYLMLLAARKAIISDTTLFVGSFAMWDTQIRAAAKYSGVIADDNFPILNKDKSVWDMSVPSDALIQFFASNTIAPWIIKHSNKLNSLNPKECYYISVEASSYNEQSFLEVLDLLADIADAKVIVDVLRGELRGSQRRKLDPEINKFIRKAREEFNLSLTYGRGLKNIGAVKHIVVTLRANRYDPPIAVYDMDLSLPEPEVNIL